MEEDMNINLQLQPIVALIAGVLVLIAPRLLTWIIGIYLIVIGVMGLLGK
jgi:threonine/homoserine efflux transporter RhtA